MEKKPKLLKSETEENYQFSTQPFCASCATQYSPGLLTVEQFGNLYNVNRTKFYGLLNNGALIGRTIDGNMTRVRVADAEIWAANLDIWQPKKTVKRGPDP